MFQTYVEGILLLCFVEINKEVWRIIHFQDYNLIKKFNVVKAYSQSKLAKSKTLGKQLFMLSEEITEEKTCQNT